MSCHLQGLFELRHLGRGSLLLTTFPANVLFSAHVSGCEYVRFWAAHMDTWTKMHLVTCAQRVAQSFLVTYQIKLEVGLLFCW